MQWLMLVATLVVTALLQRVARAAGAGVPLEAHATLALGSLLLVAYIGGAIVQRLRLPRIIGYLAAGFIAGPAWLKVVRGPELQALDVISSGALTLIAFAVGNELTLDVLRGERRTALLRIVGGAMAGPFLFVALVVLTVSPWFPLTAHQPFRDALVVALALGTMAAVSSPTLTWAVMSDVGVEGRLLSRGTLDVNVLQDLAAVVLVVVVLALALPLGSGGTVRPGVAAQTLLILGGSIVAGILLALATTQYLRVIQHHLVWLLVILAFVVSQLVRLTGMDAVLVGLAAGCALRNLAPEHSERVRAELKRCAIPVYVVFFALAGSNLRFDALDDMWPWALLLAGLRVTGLWGGLRWAGAGGGGGGGGGGAGRQAVSADWVNYGWLGLVSQGGLAVTLAAVLRRAFPEWNVTLEALLVAMIGVHTLAGPICFHWVLRRAGEVTQSAGMGEANAQDGATVAGGNSVVADGGGSRL